MQVLTKLSAFPVFFRRGVPPFAGAVSAAADLPCDEAVAEAAYRVTDRLRRWTSVRHFRDARAACRYAESTGGVVWERYLGPTGAVNWWSLNEEECALKCLAAEEPSPPAVPGAAASAAGLSVV